MTAPIERLRIHVYGTQGSGSIFPARAERAAFRRQAEVDLLERVFDDLGRRADPAGRIGASVTEILGGPPDPYTLAAYAARFDLPEPRVYGGWTTCLRLETAD